MMALKQYIMESVHTYKYTIKIAYHLTRTF
jgi:hypothetical protein